MLERYNRVLKGTSKPLFQVAKSKKRLEKLLNEAKEFENNCEFCVARCGQPLPKPKVFCSKGWAKEKLASPALQLYFHDIGLASATELKPDAAEEFSTPGAVAAWINRNSKAHKSIVISGSPSHYIPFIFSVLSKVKANLPLVVNTHPYFSEVSTSLLKQIIDLYLFTFAFSDPTCSQHIISAEDYPATAHRVCMEAEKSGDLLIHIPVMPAHLECDAKETVRWIANNLGDCAVRVLKDWEPQLISLELGRRPTITELHDVTETAYKMNINVLEE